MVNDHLTPGSLLERPFAQRLESWLEKARGPLRADVLAIAELHARAGQLVPAWRIQAPRAADGLPALPPELFQDLIAAGVASAAPCPPALAAAFGVARAVALPLAVTPRLTAAKDALVLVGWTSSAPTPAALAQLGAALEAGLSADRRARLADTMLQAVEQAPDAIELTDREARLFYANAAWERRFGYALKDVAGATVGSLFRDAAAPLHDAAFYQFTMATLAEGRPWLGTIAGRTRDGVRVISEVNVGPFTADAAGFRGNLAVRRDVGHRVQRDEALAVAHREFTAVLSAVPDGVAVLRDGRVYFANAAFLRMLQLPEDRVIGRRYIEFVHPSDRTRFEVEFRASVTRVRMVDSQDLPRFAEISTAGAVSYEGEPAMILLSRDTTLYQVAQQRLAHADKLAAIGSLAAGVAHEINNPLAFLTLNLESVRKSGAVALGEGDVEALDDALDGARRIRKIVGELHAFSRYEKNGVTQAVDVEKAVTSALNIVQNEIRHRARLKRFHEADLLVTADEGQLVQVLVNVLVNAAQSTPTGEGAGGAISVTTRGGPQGVAIIVADTGSGIPASVLPLVFEPFFSSKPRGEGSGLGLAISKQIVDSFGGRIDIASQVGQGTVVTITLPQARAAGHADAPADGNGAAAMKRRARILVVDDEEAIATALRRWLTGHQVQTADGARAALRILMEDGAFDVILCDLMMPDLPGSELYRRACEARPELRTRFVFMTGGAFVPEQAAFLDSCGCRVLTKPFDSDRLELCVQEVTHQRPRP